MSEVYALEPTTAGQVILNTTLGPIEISLWSKECPKACRNFVQLCLEGYYENSEFHRVIKGFLIQAGISADGESESIYGPAGFAREIHSRLKFRYRGIVAVASGEDKKGHSQFFITLDRADGLNGQHTIFGRVQGPTIWNVTRIGDLPCDETDRPEEPPRILNAEVVWNPFEDIVPRPRKTIEPAPEPPKPVLDRPNIKEKRVALLSFDASDDEDNARVQSAHDLLEQDPTLSKGEAPPSTEVSSKVAKLKARIAERQKEKILAAAEGAELAEEPPAKPDPPVQSEPAKSVKPKKAAKEKTRIDASKLPDVYRAGVEAERLHIRTGPGTVGRSELEVMGVEDADLMPEHERVALARKLKKRSGSAKARETQAVAKLQSFQERLRRKSGDSWANSEGLKFAVDSSTAYAFDAAHDALAVFDPLAERDQSLQRKIPRRETPHDANTPRDIAPW